MVARCLMDEGEVVVQEEEEEGSINADMLQIWYTYCSWKKNITILLVYVLMVNCLYSTVRVLWLKYKALQQTWKFSHEETWYSVSIVIWKQ